MKKNIFSFLSVFAILSLTGAFFTQDIRPVWAASVFSDGVSDEAADGVSDGATDGAFDSASEGVSDRAFDGASDNVSDMASDGVSNSASDGSSVEISNEGDISAAPQAEFSDGIFTDGGQAAPEELFTEGASDTETDFFSDSVPELSALPDLLGEGAVPAENSIEVLRWGVSLGTFSTLDEALLQVTDPTETYDIYLGEGVYECSGEFPEAKLLMFHGCNSKDKGTVISINAPAAGLNSDLCLYFASMYFSAPQSTLDLKSHTLTIYGLSLISSRLQEASDRLAITGDSNSTLCAEKTSGDAGVYGAELRIGRLFIDQGMFFLAADNVNHVIEHLELFYAEQLYFLSTSPAPLSENTVTVQKLTTNYATDMIFLENYQFNAQKAVSQDEARLPISQIALSESPHWATMNFGPEFLPPKDVDLQYIIESDQDFADLGQTFFGNNTGSINFSGFPGEQLQAHCVVAFEDKIRQQQDYLLRDHSTGCYLPDVNYNFYFGDINLADIPAPKLGQKTGTVSIPVENVQVLRSEWTSPKGLSVFKQGETYLLTFEFANLPDSHGLFTEQSSALMTIGKKKIKGTVQVSDANTLTVQFPYTIDRVASLSVPKLKKAQSVNGTTIEISWGKVKNATGYRIFRKTAKSSWKRLATISKASAVSYRDTKAKPGVTYYYTVRPFCTNKDGTTTWGKDNPKGISAKAVILAPKLVSAKFTANGMEFRWKQAKGATSYRVYRRTASSKWKCIGTVEGTVIGVYDNSFKAAGTYYYTVRGMYGKTRGKSSSKGVKATVPKLSTPKLTRTFWGKDPYIWNPRSYAGISWNRVKYAQYYKIYRRDAGSSKWKCVGVQPASEGTSYYDYNASPLSSYYYTVRPFLGQYRGPCSSTGMYLRARDYINWP